MSLDLWIGLAAAVGASVLFGTVFVPIKKVACGDGFATQLFVCIGAFLGGAVVNGILNFPPIYGFAMIGGALWCIANAFAIQIMNRLGMALSILVWNTLSCLTGWATSRYGLFGLPAAIPASLALNYVGITILIAGVHGSLTLMPTCLFQPSWKGISRIYHNDDLQMSIGIGLSACGVSSVFFGSMFVPIRKYNAADGMFAQWVMSAAILFVGFLVFCIQGFPGFYPLAMLGGMLWTIGNATAIPIISRLGMALGILIWNTTNCLTGWAGGRFGLFGMKPNPPASDILNYGGLVLVIIGGILFSRVKGNSSDEEKDEKEKTDLDLVRVEEVKSEEKELLDEPEKEVEEEAKKSEKEKESLHDGKQRIIGIAMSLIAGVFYGMTFVPVIYMMDNPETFPNYPMDSLSYVFSHYFGIFLTATTLFIGYAMIKRNQPIIPQPIFLPAFLSGLLWAIAQTSFFIANQHLSQAVTFPIITMLPGCIASAWSILYFREIKGRRNLTILWIAMSITLTGAMLVGLSKAVHL